MGELLRVATRAFFKDNGPTWAAAIAYYSLLSVFPLLLAGASIASYFVDPQWAVRQATGRLGEFLPQGQAEIERVVRQTITAGRGGGLLFIVPLLWTGSLVFGAISQALNYADARTEHRSFKKRMLVRLVMLLTVGILFLVALISPAFARLLRLLLNVLPAGGEFLFDVLVNAIPPLFLLGGFFAVYRFVPSRRPDWRAAFFGAVMAMILFVAAKPLFLGYVRELARYSLVYGSLAGIVIFVFWAWVVAMIGIFGGQVSSHSQRIFIEMSDVELPPPDAGQKRIRKPTPQP
jgi:membrane protein